MKLYPSYHTKDDVIGPYVPNKIHETERDRKSYFASMEVANLGRVNIECDGKDLAYINYKFQTTIGMNIRHYGIKCEHAYVRPGIKSFFTKHYVPTTDSYTYHIMKIINKSGKGDFVIRRIYNLELFDQLLQNAIELDDFTLGSYAFEKNGTPKYQTIFSFDKTYLKIEYLNGTESKKYTIPATNGRTKQQITTDIEIHLIEGDNISPPQLTPEAQRLKLADPKEFVLEGEKVFTINDANVLVTDNLNLNPKLKTSFTYDIDKQHGFNVFPTSDNSYKIIQVKKDWRVEETAEKKVKASKLVYFLTKFLTFPEKDDKLELDKSYTLQVWEYLNYFEDTKG